MSQGDARRLNRGHFQKGRSGNPGGRPKKSIPPPASTFDIIIDKTLTANRGGIACEIPVEEALQHRTYQDALAGKRMAIREVLRWIVRREQWTRLNRPAPSQPRVTMKMVRDPANAGEALFLLDIAREDPHTRPVKGGRLQLLLEPWAVKEALKLHRGALTRLDIIEIRCCTRQDAELELLKARE